LTEAEVEQTMREIHSTLYALKRTNVATDRQVPEAFAIYRAYQTLFAVDEERRTLDRELAWGKAMSVRLRLSPHLTCALFRHFTQCATSSNPPDHAGCLQEQECELSALVQTPFTSGSHRLVPRVVVGTVKRVLGGLVPVAFSEWCTMLNEHFDSMFYLV